MSLAPEPDAFAPQLYRVGEAIRELADTVTLELTPLSGERPEYEPGQFNMLYVFGVGEAAISISGDPAQGGAFVHTVREVGAVSRAIAGLKAGAVAGVRGPYGTGWPVEAAEGVARRTSANHSSMVQDIQRGAPTEIDAICGEIEKAGQAFGIPTPNNYTVWQLVRALREKDK